MEFAGRFALETSSDGGEWLKLLEALSPDGAHGSWRRNALLAILRSEVSLELLRRCSAALLDDDGSLLSELITAVIAVETTSPADLVQDVPSDQLKDVSIPKSLRLATTRSAARLLKWCLVHREQIPLQVIMPMVKLVEVTFFYLTTIPGLGGPAATMLFDWLLQLDVRDATVTIPRGDSPSWRFRDGHRRMVEELRTMSLLLSAHSPDRLKTYLRAIADETDLHKVKEIRPLSAAIARSAPQELADLIIASLVETEEG